MNDTFVDTSFLMALLLDDDAFHEQAVGWQRRTRGELLTTEYVLIELLDGLAVPRLRGRAIDTVNVLRTDPRTRVVAASTALLDEALQMYVKHRDKSWGMTDCISFVVMQRAGICDALTTDHHFEQAGFRALQRLPLNA